MPPPQHATQPPPPTVPLPQDLIAQITDIVLSTLQARFSTGSQGPADRPAPQPALAAHAPSSAADGPREPTNAAPAPLPPPPAAGHGLDTSAAPGAPGALHSPPPRAPLGGNGPSHTGLLHTPTSSRLDARPPTPTSSNIGAFLNDARGRSQNDHHARQRSRSRSHPRGPRNHALARPRAPRGRSPGDRSSRSPRRPPRSLSRRWSPVSDDRRRDDRRRGNP